MAGYSVGVVIFARKNPALILVVRARMEYSKAKRGPGDLQEVANIPTPPRNVHRKLPLRQGLIQDLRRDHIYPTKINPEGDKLMRMASHTAYMEAGNVFLPHDAPWLGEFKKELLALQGTL